MENKMSENPWNAASRIIEIAGNYELAIFNEYGDRVAIATGITKDACRINATEVIEGLQLRAERLQSGTQPIKNPPAERDFDAPEP